MLGVGKVLISGQAKRVPPERVMDELRTGLNRFSLHRRLIFGDDSPPSPNSELTCFFVLFLVQGQFLVSNMDEEAFKEWLAQTTGLTSNHLDVRQI